ncbi:DUF599 domain-containing protein [Falsiroseomonas selenitidurans]|uniref:DUF599 domain-containing protein n=1 Tax=Falsiroseomonas selenitidurans TaxID=2716335 RepID=A0ABX1E914_9PROT|nr:DUF599 domain-containing protein [Falsiroseomonas selenitidurans]NKC33684.1 DUF599 domain-containing protein [Falsiroseomonas selenitidurans]
MTMPFSLYDGIALAIFAACWLGYATVVDKVPRIRRASVIAAMDQHRRRWMHAMLTRDNRIADMAAIGNLMNSTSFLATTSIFILGGLVALLGAPDLGRRVVAALPFAAVPDDAGWELKIGLLLVIFVNAFFELTWALRQFNYTSILIGGIPSGQPDAEMLAAADMAAEIANRAARHFNTGLRSYYFGLAALAWVVHPLALVATSLFVLRELHRREFRSVLRQAVAVQR